MVATDISSIEFGKPGQPSPEMLKKINKFRPKDSTPYEAEDLYVAIASVLDNLVRVDQVVSHGPDLIEKFANTLPGKPMGFRHTESGGGRFFDAAFTISKKKPAKKRLDEYGFGKANEAILEMDGGYFQAWGWAFFPANSPEAEKLRMAQYSELSIGPHSREWIDRCHECQCGNQGGIFGGECPNIHPYYEPMFLRYAWDDDERKAIKERVPLFARREAKVWTASEVSIVFEPALPTARIVRQMDRV